MIRIPECFELKRVARWIEKEHRGLLADLPFESNVRFNHKINVGRGESAGKFLPCFPLKHHAKVGYRNIVTIHRVVVYLRLRIAGRFVMGNDLMAKEIEINPFVSTSTFTTPQQINIKTTCLGNISNRKGEMKRRNPISHNLNPITNSDTKRRDSHERHRETQKPDARNRPPW